MVGLKFTKFVISILEPTISFSLNFVSVLGAMKHNSSVFFFYKSLYALDKSIQSKWKFSDFRLLSWKLTKFLMSFFKPQVSFPLNFAPPFSVMAHNSSEMFQLKHYMLWKKRVYQCTIFQTFECSKNSSFNSSWHFWNHKVKVYSNFASLFIVMKDNSSVFLSSNLIYFGQK